MQRATHSCTATSTTPRRSAFRSFGARSRGPDERYQLSGALVERHWSQRTRGVLIASPSNPTGTLATHAEIAHIADIVAQRRGRLIVDEIYLGLSYDAPARSALSISDEAFVISSFSKHFTMTGWRLGWLVAPQRHVRDLEKLAQNLYISLSTLAQRAALACFSDENMAIIEARRQAFRERRDFLVPALRDIGFGSVDTWRRLFRLRRLLAFFIRQPCVLPGRSRRNRRCIHARHRLRRQPRPRARALRLHRSMQKLEEGVRRLRQHLC